MKKHIKDEWISINDLGREIQRHKRHEKVEHFKARANELTAPARNRISDFGSHVNELTAPGLNRIGNFMGKAANDYHELQEKEKKKKKKEGPEFLNFRGPF